MIEPENIDSIRKENSSEQQEEITIDILVEEPQAPDWHLAFKELNEKLGNDVWGARVEQADVEDDRNLEFIRIFITNAKFERSVLKETSGILAGRKILFTILEQEKVQKFLEQEG